MTDRFGGFIVTLDREIREDDAEEIIKVLLMIKGVVSVTGVVTEPQYHMAREQIRHELRRTLYSAIDMALMPKA